MAKDNALLLQEVLAADVLVEIAVEFHQQLARGPHGPGAEVENARVFVVEQPPQLFGQREHPLGFFVLLGIVAVARLPGLFFLLGLLHQFLDRCQPELQQLLIEPQRGQGSRRQEFLLGHADVARAPGAGKSKALSKAWIRSLRSAIPNWFTRNMPNSGFTLRNSASFGSSAVGCARTGR